MRRPVALLVAFAAILSHAGPAEGASLEFRECGDVAFTCARLSVPLDRAGVIPGRISLLVKRRETFAKRRRGVLVVLAGGPGQSATEALEGESSRGVAAALTRRDVIVHDQRGTGRSGLLRCRSLERAGIVDFARPAAQCAKELGPRRALYTSKDTADDLEAIRKALGVEKLSLYGVSYGTRTAQAYALRYPSRVDRMVLDSVIGADGYDTLQLDSFAAIPRALDAVCRTACRRFTSSPVADLDAVARSMARTRLRGQLPDFRGDPQRQTMDRVDLFDLLLAGDFVPPLRTSLPGALAAARAGDPAPLLRLNRRAKSIQGGRPDPLSSSPALFAATTCEEAKLPWTRTTPLSERPAQAAQMAAAFPESAFGPFGRATAIDSYYVNFCKLWPQAAASPVPGPGPLPDVPTLLLEGEDDLRTPVETARRVAETLPRARLVVVPARGHSVLFADTPGCAGRAFDRFLNGGRIAARCPARRRREPIEPPAPTSLAGVSPAAGTSGRRGKVAAAVGLTLADVHTDSEASVVRRRGAVFGGGLRAGRYSLLRQSLLTLRGVAYVPGVRVTGDIKRFGETRQTGLLRVTGPENGSGTLTITGPRFSGVLGGQVVRGRLTGAKALLTARDADAAPARDPLP